MPVDPVFAAAVKKEHARILPLLRALEGKPQFYAFVPHAKSAAPGAKLSEPAPLLLHSKMSALPVAKVVAHAKTQLKVDLQVPALVYAGTVQRTGNGLVFVIDKAASKGSVTPAAGQKLLKTLLKQLPEMRTAVFVADSWSPEAEAAARTEAAKDPAPVEEADEHEVVEEEAVEDEPSKPEAPADGRAAARYRTLADDLRGDLAAAGALSADDKRNVTKLVSEAKARAEAGKYDEASAILEKVQAWLASRARAADAAASRVATGPSLASFSKARLIWVAAQKQARTELQKLVTAVLSDPETQADPDFPKIQTRMNQLGRALDRYGEELVDVMDEVTNAQNDETKAAAMKKSLGVLRRYRQQLDRDTLLKTVDESPYVDVKVFATLKKSLDGIGTLLAT